MFSFRSSKVIEYTTFDRSISGVRKPRMGIVSISDRLDMGRRSLGTWEWDSLFVEAYETLRREGTLRRGSLLRRK